MEDTFEMYVHQRRVRQSITGRLTLNLAANIGNLGINILIGFLFLPYLIQHLGVAAYGLVPLAITVTSYLSLITTASNGAVGRFLSIALEKGDHREANRIFNTTLFTNLGIILLLLGPTIWVSLHVSEFLRIPHGYEMQCSGLFICTILAFLLGILGSSFSVAAFCRNRLDLTNALSILGNLARVGVVVLLFTFFTPKVWQVGLGLLLSAVLGLLGSIAISRRLTPMLTIQWGMISLKELKILAHMGGWMLVTQIGAILFQGVDLVLVNRFLGPEAGGQYGAVMQWSTLLITASAVVASVFAPPFLQLYASGDRAGLAVFARQAMKLSTILAAFLAGLICGLSKPLLSVWLGPEFAKFSPLLVLMTVHLALNLGVMPLFFLQVVTGDVRLPGILTGIMGIMNVGMSLFLVGVLDWGMYGVAAAGAVMLTIKNSVFTPVYTALIIGERWWIFIRGLLWGLVLVLVTASVSGIWSHLARPDSWLELIIAGSVITTGYIAGVWSLVLNDKDRSKLQLMIRIPQHAFPEE